MNNRSKDQIRLQETVEGFSVVATSYYGVNLLAGLFAPLSKFRDWTKTEISALVTVPVILLVFYNT